MKITGRIAISAARKMAEDLEMDMIVVLAYDHATGHQHVVSYGKTKKDCDTAAKSAYWAKAALGFDGTPKEECKHDWHRCPRCGG